MIDFDAARAFANSFLDAASVATDDDYTVEVLQLAVNGALETGAVQVDISDSGEVDIDLSAAIGGTMLLVRHLVSRVRDESGRPDEEVIHDARAWLEEHCTP
jgi:hypothetical protein